MRIRLVALVLSACALALVGCRSVPRGQTALVTASGKPAEGSLEAYLGETFFDRQVVFAGGGPIREPYLAVAVDGTVLAVQNQAVHRQTGAGRLRRSEDGGASWGEPIAVPFGFLDSNFIPDENSGDLLVVRLWPGRDTLWRSRDQGRTWREEPIVLRPNEVMKWLEQTGLKRRGAWPERGDSGEYLLHANASESGITLRHGKHRGRLLVTATFRPHATAHPSDRDPPDASYSCAIYSDDHGATWQVSGLFPEGKTEEAALAELADGRIYYNSRSCSGYYAAALTRDLRPDEHLRREAWSHDGGHTWESLRVSRVLPDGGGFGRGYGNKGGLVRLPVAGRDILIYSNTDTAGGAREKLTVWASLDGGDTWPVKRRIHDGPSAYSSLGAGRPGTPSEGMIYLLFEGGPEGMYSAMHVARFNLAWILAGERTGADH